MLHNCDDNHRKCSFPPLLQYFYTSYIAWKTISFAFTTIGSHSFMHSSSIHEWRTYTDLTSAAHSWSHRYKNRIMVYVLFLVRVLFLAARKKTNDAAGLSVRSDALFGSTQHTHLYDVLTIVINVLVFFWSSNTFLHLLSIYSIGTSASPNSPLVLWITLKLLSSFWSSFIRSIINIYRRRAPI